MNNEELGRLHLENKKRRRGGGEEEQQEQKQYVMCLDLTNDEEEELQQQPQHHEDEHPPQLQHIVARVLPVQDIELLEEAEKEFGEVIRPPHRSKDRLKKHRGDSKKEAIVLCDDILCDCKVKCLEGYECYANKHVMCINLIRDDRKCYLCGSKIV
jgi:hypothetical protein